MKNFVKLFVLFFIILDFSSCMDNDNKDPYYFFVDEPAIIESVSDDASLRDYAIVRTAYGKFCVPSLKDDVLQVNDILWSSFVVEKTDENKVQMPGNQYYYNATGFKYSKIDSSKVIIPADAHEFESYLSDDYTEKINRAVLYKTYVDSLLFFEFEHGSPSTVFYYELFLNPTIESSNGHPTLYIRAKERLNYAHLPNQSRSIYAFDMTDFVDYYKRNFSGKNMVQFNLKYYVETKNGKDVYREFLSNPLSWHLY
ncbi:MAG: hypothetical protein LBC48_04460 [Dysgonamonadaceae bacterium]|jgi:hypothetical protein|nr:hypothetical protein [Dysgonamonadaceae bacterium]